MKFNDAVWGGLIALFGVALFAHVQSFPTIPGQNVGPALFPGIIAVALVVCGVLLVVRGVAARRHAGSAWAEVPVWLRSRPQWLGFVVLVAVNVFYLLAVERLGFVIVAFFYLLALLRVLAVPWPRACLVSLVMALAVHTAFYKLLKVPLPWGVLERFAW